MVGSNTQTHAGGCGSRCRRRDRFAAVLATVVVVAVVVSALVVVIVMLLAAFVVKVAACLTVWELKVSTNGEKYKALRCKIYVAQQDASVYAS